MPTVDLGLVVGSNGQGVPTGGSAGQILAKKSSSNYDTGWVPMSAAAAAAFGIVENGNAASQTIAAGQYVIWKGVLYTADAAIASGTTLAASGGNKNLTATPNGGLNALNGKTENNSKEILKRAYYDIVSLSNVEAVTYTFTKNTPFILLIERANTESTNNSGLYIGWAQNNGHVVPVLESSTCTVSMSGKVLTMTASNTNMVARIISLYDYN